MPKSKRKKGRSKSKTGFFGVRKKLSGKYEATVWIDGKIKYLGSSYDTAKQAAKAYEKEAIKLRRPFSSLNYPKKAPVGYTPIQQPLRSSNTVGYRGVTKRGKNYHAQTQIDGKKTGLGNFDTAKEAAIAYDRAVLKANKSTTLLNFPDMVHNLDVEVEPKRKRRRKVIKKKVAKKVTKKKATKKQEKAATKIESYKGVSKATMAGSEILLALAFKQ